MNNKFLLPTLLAAAATSAWAVDPAPSPKEDKRVAAATTGEDVGISARDGITVSGADVMVTRNGRTEKLEAPLTLDGGTRINPDGTVKLADGRNITLRAEQRLTFDGRLLNSPIVETPATAVAGVATNTTTVTVDPRTGVRSFIFVDPATGRRLNVSRNADGQVIYRDVETGGVFTAGQTSDPRSGLPIFTDPRSGIGMTVGVDPRTGQPIYTNSATGAPMTFPNNGTTTGAAGNVNGTTTNGVNTAGTLNGTNTGALNGTNTGTINGTTTGTGTLNGTRTGTTTNGTTGTTNGTTGTNSGTGTTTRSGTGTTGGTTSGTTGGTRSGTSGTTGTSGGGAASPGTSGGAAR